MSYTLSSRPARTTTRPATTSNTEHGMGNGDGDGDRGGGGIRCKCPKPAALRRAGPTAKNPGRYFYTCPRNRDDPKHCNFFKWEDDVGGAGGGGGGGGGGVGGGVGGGEGRTLGGAPLTPSRRRLGIGTSTPSRLATAGTTGIGDWFSPSKRPATTPTHQTTLPCYASSSAATPTGKKRRTDDNGSSASDPDVNDGIDWAHVDAESLVADAEARTPHRTPASSAPGTAGPAAAGGASAGVTPTGGATAVKPGTPASRLQERLLSAAGKRKREEGDEEGGNGGGAASKGANTNNPFIDNAPPSTPRAERSVPIPGSTHSVTSIASAASAGTVGSALSTQQPHSLLDDEMRPTHPALVPFVASLDGLAEHLARQDRLVRAAEAMKKSMRATIHNLQERIKELENENEELKRNKS